MTRRQLYEVTKRNRFIAVRESSGHVFGVNCKVADLALKSRGFTADDQETRIKSHYPISFQEYIRIKKPFKYLTHDRKENSRADT